MRKIYVGFLFMVSSHLIALAQCKSWNWPVNRVETQVQLALFQDAAKAKLYKQAVPPLNWLLANAPDLNVSVYIRGAEVFDGLAKAAKTPVQKKKYVDSLLWIYDQRMEYCHEDEYVASRKALASYKYNINGPNPEVILPLMDQAFSLNGDHVMDGLIEPYMQTIVLTQIKKKSLSEDDILKRYDNIVEIITKKLRAAQGDKAVTAELNNHKKKVDDLLLKVVKVDCDFVHKNLVPKYRQSQDVALAKRIFGYLLINKCIDDAVWLETGEVVFKTEKDYGLAKNLGRQFTLTDSLRKADYYYSQALALAPSASDSADMYLLMGGLAVKNNDLIEARTAFQKCLKLDPTQVEAYARIGDLYFNSFQICSRLKSEADDRAIYLLAYDYYKKAGDHLKMSFAKKSFPSREEIFLMNYKAGEKIRVECWIQESTTIRTRD